MNSRRQQTALALSGCLAIAISGCGGARITTGSSASCTAPWLTTVRHAPTGRPAPGMTRRNAIHVSPGQMLRVYGHGYQSCHDTNHQPPASPFSNLEVFITQGHNRQTLATVSAHHPHGDFSTAIHLPANLRTGPATVDTSYAGDVPLYLEVRHYRG